MKQQFMLGADPEIFVGDATSVRSVLGKIGGTKDHPLPLPLGQGFAVQEDNVALEFNIPASGSKEAFVQNISSAMEFLETVVSDQYGYKFVNESAVSFPEEELADPRSWIFGCDPDYNAWTGKRNPRPKADDKTLRTCGGHVHVGCDLTKEQKIELVKMLDRYLGVPSTLMDKGEKRKQLYGCAGAMRFKPYGLEYRTLSNYWVFDKNRIAWVYEQVDKALDAVLNGESASQDRDDILAAINGNDKEVAIRLVNKYNLELV